MRMKRYIRVLNRDQNVAKDSKGGEIQRQKVVPLGLKMVAEVEDLKNYQK